MKRTVLIASLVAFLVLLAPLALAAGGGGGLPAPGNAGSGRGPDLTKVFKEGSQLLAEGECKKAEKKFRKILKSVAKNPEANYLRGAALQCQGKHKSAIRYFKKARRYDKKLFVASEQLGVSYLALGKLGDAQDELDRLAKSMRACAESCPKKLKQAHSRLRAVIAKTSASEGNGSSGIAPDTKDSHTLLFDSNVAPQTAYLGAVELIHAEQFEKAIEELRELTRAIGPHADVLNYLGYAHRRIGLFEEARGYYEQALSMDPLHRGANEYLGEMWVELGRFDDARKRLAVLDRACPFGCAEYEDLKRIIEPGLAAIP